MQNVRNIGKEIFRKIYGKIFSVQLILITSLFALHSCNSLTVEITRVRTNAKE